MNDYSVFANLAERYGVLLGAAEGIMTYLYDTQDEGSPTHPGTHRACDPVDEDGNVCEIATLRQAITDARDAIS